MDRTRSPTPSHSEYGQRSHYSDIGRSPSPPDAEHGQGNLPSETPGYGSPSQGPSGIFDSSKGFSISADIRFGSSRPQKPLPVMPPVGRTGLKETRLVIGIDYGTTYTGVAFSTQSGSVCALKEITVNDRWGAQMRNQDKVPSVISYSPPSERMEQQWGRSLSPNSVSHVHTKLELGIQPMLGELDLTIQVLDGMKNLDFSRMMVAKGIPAYSHKSPEEIVTDYLEKIFQYLDQTVNKFTKAFRNNTTTDIVVTIPTDWSYMAMNSTYRAMTKAGFNQINFPKLQDVMFITESEAAALYVTRHYSDEKGHAFLKENQYFVLVDAGGGTVDVVSYRVTRLQPTLVLEQVGKPTGKKCGSIFINRSFLKWLRKQLGEQRYRHLDPNLDINKDAFHASESSAMRYLMDKFDEKKQTFTPESGDTFIDLPEPLDNLTIPGVVDQGQITIPRKLMEEFFDDCIEEVVDMVRYHIDEIENRGSEPDNVFLVGGFGASEYLQKQIEDTLELCEINFRVPEKSWTAVVRGAVICGVEKETLNSLKKTTACKHDYAICLDELFSEMSHQNSDMVQTNGNVYAQSQLIWLLSKGDLILADQPRRVEREFDIKFPKARKGTIRLPIYRNTNDEKGRPTRFKNSKDRLEVACTLDIDLGRIVKNSVQDRGFGLHPTICHTTLKLVMTLDWDVLEACLEWKGTELSKKPVSYNEIQLTTESTQNLVPEYAV